MTTVVHSEPFRERDDVAGARRGRYLLLERVGRGGMGVVYAAYDPELDRRVAIKLLRMDGTGQDAERHAGRLRREAQALARLSHENVVHVFDVGRHGREVFIAMELVDGPDFGTWLAQQSRTPSEVIDRMLEAGRGLAAAHRAGLVHRDFKRSNVLIGPDGRARVVDFGLAIQASSTELGPGTSPTPAGFPKDIEHSLTPSGWVIGTPHTMAPEQHAGRASDARADQYAFCLVCFEAVLGRAAFGSRMPEALAGLKQHGRIIRPRPEERALCPWLWPLLLRGMEPRPEDRWPDLDALLSAIERHRAPRRRAWIALASAVALGVAAVWIAATPDDRCATGAGRIAEAWGPSAREATERAVLASDLPYAADTLQRTTAALDDWADGWSTAYRRACAAGPEHAAALSCLRRHLTSGRATTRVLSRSDPRVVERALSLVDALPSPDACNEAHDGAPDSTVIDAVRGDLAAAESLRIGQQLQDARRGYERARERARAAGNDALLADALLGLARVASAEGDVAMAARLGDEAYLTAIGSGNDAVAAAAAVEMADTTMKQTGDFAEAQRWDRHAQAVLQRAPDRAIEVQRLLGHSARASRVGRVDEALASAAAAMALAEAPPALRAAITRACKLESTGYEQRGEPALAESFARRSRDLAEEQFGPEHPRTAEAEVVLANALAGLRHSDEARAMMEDAIRKLDAAYGPDAPVTATAHNDLSNLLVSMGEPAAALAQVSRAIELVDDAGPAWVPEKALYYANRSHMLRELGRSEEALDAARAATRLWDSPQLAAGDHGANRAIASNNLATMLIDAERYDEAVTEARTALARLPERERNHPIVAYLELNLAVAMLRLGSDLPGTTAELQRVIDLASGLDGPRRDAVLVQALYTLGDAFYIQGELQRARETWERALPIAKAAELTDIAGDLRGAIAETR